MPSQVYLGPNFNYWCNSCNIPILELKKCPICGSSLKLLPLVPPYEINPAFEKDLALIRKVLDKQYGENVGIRLVPADKIVLENKAPYYDRMDEIIVDGFVLGNIRFNPAIMDWEFSPRIEGARRLAQLTTKKWLQIDDGAIEHISQGANVLAPGVVDYDPEFQVGDYLIILTSKNQAIATGPTKYSAGELGSIKKGMIVKTKDHNSPEDPQIRPGGQDWAQVIEANKQTLEKRANQAKKFIQRIHEKFKPYPVAISFSGGKDSLVILILVLEALGPTRVFFIDTGIEFDETVKFTKEIIQEFKLTDKFTYKKSTESFWDNLEKFGPPAKDYRWCCKVIKLANITEFFNEFYSDTKVVTYIGIRQYESSSRHQDKRIWTNSYLPQQIGAAPIFKWNSLLVWMYLLYKKVRMNPLYFEGYKRIGCIFCPANKLAELQILKELHPELYNRWMDFLRTWADKYNLSKDWAERGFWRWRKFKEKGQLDLAENLGIPKEKILWTKKNEHLQFNIVKGISPCRDGSFSIEGRIEGYIDLESIQNQLIILGDPKYSQELGVLSLHSNQATLNLFSDGTITIRGEKQEIEKIQPLIFELIKRANDCIGCGICIPQCAEQALCLKDQKIWVDPNRCTHLCFENCLKNCPIVKYT